MENEESTPTKSKRDMLRSSLGLYNKNALIFGAGGAMGRGVLAAFQAKGWTTTAVDIFKPAGASSADNFIVLPGTTTPEKELEQLVRELRRANKGSFSAVVNAAGGWAGGGAGSAAIAAQTQLMWNQSVRSSILCAHVAVNMGTNNVLLVLTGSAAATGPTAGMLAYGTAKAATHHIARSVAGELSERKGDAGSASVCVLPVTIDTPGNRAGMPGADFSNWTPVSEIAGTIVSWAAREKAVPATGSLVEVSTSKGQSTWTVRN